jgi:serine protease Do
VLPAVVSIQSKSVPKVSRRNRPQMPGGEEGQEMVPDQFRRFFEQLQKQQEQQDESPRFSFGSGFLVDPSGVIVTNYHVVDGADQVEVTLMDGRSFTSHDIHSDRKTDLAIVRIHAKGPLPYLHMGNSDEMQIGDRVLAVGAPFGLTGTVTAGIVSAKGRSLNLNMYEDFIQTDAAINPGNSGGPLVNLEGHVIGINSAIKSRTGGFQGIGMAISSNLVKRVMTDLLHGGVVHRGYLGIKIGVVPADVAQRLGATGDTEAVQVSHVYEDSPAAAAGLKPGDLITAVNGQKVKDSHELQTEVANMPLNKSATLSIIRDGKPMTLTATIREQPANYGLTENTPAQQAPEAGKEPVALDKLGIQATDLTPELAQELGYKESDHGAVITKVNPGSPAEDAGLTRGVLIMKVDKQQVSSAMGLRAAVEKASLTNGILLQVRTRTGDVAFVMVKANSDK